MARTVSTAEQECRDRIKRALGDYFAGLMPCYSAMAQITDALADHEWQERLKGQAKDLEQQARMAKGDA